MVPMSPCPSDRNEQLLYIIGVSSLDTGTLVLLLFVSYICSALLLEYEAASSCRSADLATTNWDPCGSISVARKKIQMFSFITLPVRLSRPTLLQCVQKEIAHNRELKVHIAV